MWYVGGFDPGYGGGKMVLMTRDGVRTAVVPSIVGMGDTAVGRLGIGNVGRRRRRRLLDRVVVDGVGYLVGDGTERYAAPMEAMDFLRLRGGPAVQALFYDCTYRVLGPGRHDLALLVGLPVEVMADDRNASVTLDTLRDWMVASHRYRVNGDEVVLRVRRVNAMAQPVGAFFAWGLDNEGRWTRGADALDAGTGVLDVGFNTLDLFAVGGAELARRYTDGDTLGMRRAAEYLIKAVGGPTGRDSRCTKPTR